jgi:uncharacterized protein (DUF2336 family)
VDTVTENFDANYLFKLARDKSAETRTTLANIISDLFDNQGDILSDRERKLIFNIMHGLIHEVEISVRKNFSKQLASLPDAPQELLSELINDEIDVAYPLLVKSTVLRDMDLVDVIRLRTHEHQLAISLREDISEGVSDALVETGSEGVIKSLLKNQNAKISESAMEYLVEQSKRVDTYQEPLLHRHELKEDLAKRMFMWVSAALRKHIVNRYEINNEEVENLLERAAREGIEETIDNQKHKPTGAKKLAAALKGDGEKAANLLVEVLSDGEVPLFLALLAELTELKEYLTARMVFEEGGDGLAIACKAIGVPDAQFDRIFRMSRGAKPHLAMRLRIDSPRIKKLYRHMNPEDAQRVLRRWQRGSDFLAAMRSLNVNG